MPGRLLVLSVIAIGLLSGTGCVKTVTRELKSPERASTLDGKSPFLKAHLLDGRVCILTNWKVDERAREVSGDGEMLGINREILERGPMRVPLEQVALFETNVMKQSPSVAALAVVTGASLAVTAACLADPKACFGSCPTFYVTDGSKEILQAEGFSASVAPALEDTDLDALYRAQPQSRVLSVRMTNEALETHVVRRVRVLAVRRPEGGRVFATGDGTFWEAFRVLGPQRCAAPEGDCLAALEAFDGRERFSRSGSEDLAEREILDLEFPPCAGARAGLVLASRQTLLSTFLLYQGLAYLGSSATGWLAAMERSSADARRQAEALGRTLGGIEVLVPDGAGGWRLAGEVQETGPLATEVKVVPLPGVNPEASVRVRLRLTRGDWRLDWAGLAELGTRVEPLRLETERVLRAGHDDPEARMSLRGAGRPLVTLPGDEVTLQFRLPSDFRHYELFLESRGYYLEWMRREWMAEENPAMAAMMLLAPAAALRELAPKFKGTEDTMESLFWRSRYARN
jgi:hypothetical protein